MIDALEWIKESLSDVADDFDNGDDADGSGIPLVPILDCSRTAIENSQFKKLLHGLSIREPASEQVN